MVGRPDGPGSLSGGARLEFMRRLGTASARELATVLEIPGHVTDRAGPGELPELILDRLTRRHELWMLPDALRRIGRSDLAGVLEPSTHPLRRRGTARWAQIGAVVVVLVGGWGITRAMDSDAATPTGASSPGASSPGGASSGASSSGGSPSGAPTAAVFRANVDGTMAEGHDGERFSLWSRPSTSICSAASPCPYAGSTSLARVATGEEVAVTCVTVGQRVRNGAAGMPAYYEDDRWLRVLRNEAGAPMYLSNVFFARSALPDLPACR